MKSRIERVRITIARVFVSLLILFIMVTGSAWQVDLTLTSSLLFFHGIFFAAVAAAGRLWCSIYIAGRKTHTLVTIGPYSICRNPLYLFNLLGGVGVALTSRTLLIPATVLIGFFSYFPFVISQEEKKLIDRHGTAFHGYSSTTPKFWPDLNKLSEPQFYLVKPIIFRKHLFSAGGFITLVGFIEIIRGLQSMSYLPILFRIY
jgi:protein-S-isoprenylcysteine O-methyltransferase Ste14